MLREDGIIFGNLEVTPDTVTAQQLLLIRKYREILAREQAEYEDRKMREMEDSYGW